MANLSIEQTGTIVNALYTAARAYEDCAKSSQVEVNKGLAAYSRIVDQFNKQATDAP